MGKNSKKYKIFHLYRERTFFLFISPWLIGFLVLTLFPMGYSLFAALPDGMGSQSQYGLVGTILKTYFLTIRLSGLE